jgi:hypothetical protein
MTILEDPVRPLDLPQLELVETQPEPPPRPGDEVRACERAGRGGRSPGEIDRSYDRDPGGLGTG